jgi:response regulator RpfG family c-di-GMP phosphodiesterase
MVATRAKPNGRDGKDRGIILLLDDSASKRTARAKLLMRRGLSVEVAASLERARELWRPGRYVVVLVAVQNDIRRAAEFCDEIQQKHPQQVVSMLVPIDRPLPGTQCRGLLWPEESLDYFLARVETLADFARAA